MSKIKGIYAASMSIFNKNLSLNIEKTLAHAEKIIEQGCHGAVIFGSTGQAQLIPVNEKIALLNKLSKSRHKDKFLVGTGFNSLVENITYRLCSYLLVIVCFPFSFIIRILIWLRCSFGVLLWVIEAYYTL